MAHFKFTGNVYGGTVDSAVKIIIRKQDGTAYVFNNVPAGQDLGIDITDAAALRYLRCNPQFQEI